MDIELARRVALVGTPPGGWVPAPRAGREMAESAAHHVATLPVESLP
jgi:hypothetical protein